MPPKSKLAGTLLTPERHAQLKAAAAAQGLTVSRFLGRLIDIVLEEDEIPAPEVVPSKYRREHKVTLRLSRDVWDLLEREAAAQGITPSTWGAALFAARLRDAPQMVPTERRGVRAAYRQLRGVAANVNQIARALNRAVLIGADADLTRAEVEGIRRDVAGLRFALSVYAEGRYTFQTGQEPKRE